MVERTGAESLLERSLKSDRWIVVAGLTLLTVLAWVHLVGMALSMEMPTTTGEALAMVRVRPWSLADFAMMFWMWMVMMVAMMLPSAAPMLLLFARVGRKAKQEGHPFAPTATFATGYLAAWAAFSFAATLFQWYLHTAALLSPRMVVASPLIGGVLLVVAGVYQLTPLKDTCLKHCRAPMNFITRYWRPGIYGAFRMGVEHGAFCVGCCWALMGLLFFGGVMDFIWIVGIAVFVLLEKVMPVGASSGRITGGILALCGILVSAAAMR